MKTGRYASLLALLVLASVTSATGPHKAAGGSPPVAAFTWNPCFACAAPGDVVFFNANWSATPSGLIKEYVWNFGDGSPVVNYTFPTATHIFFDFAGNWLVTLRVTDSQGSTDAVSQQVVFDTAPIFDFTPQKPTVGESVAFNASKSDSLRDMIEGFDWSFGDGAFGSGKVAAHSYATPGIYRVTLSLVIGDLRPSVSKTVIVSGSLGLTVTVATDKPSYISGEPVQVKVMLSNNGPDTVTLHFGSSCQASFQILDTSGTVLFDWLRHVACLAVLTQVTLGPGQSVSYNFSWDQSDDSGRQVGAGFYWVRGLITSNEPTPTGVASITIVLKVQIDVKPGNPFNRISVKSQGTVLVAILSDPSFDARQVNPSTVRFGRTGTESSPVSSTITDANNDGLPDIVLQFNVQDTGFKAGDTLALLTGRTTQGISFAGSDHIQAFLPGDVNGDLKVDILDAALLAYSYDSREGSAAWNLNADFDENSLINILDAAVLAMNYGQHA